MTELHSPPKPIYNARDPESFELFASLTSKILTHGAPLSSEPCREGTLSYVTEDEPIGGALKLFGEWAHSETALLSKLIEKGNTVLDVGANIGCHSISFCNFVGATGVVHAFEPQPLAADLTAYNLHRNGHKNFSVWQIGLGDSTGVFTVPNPARSKIKNLGGVSLEAKSKATSEEIEVKVFPLDSLKLGKVDFIKCDVEGMEPQVLRGGTSLLSTNLPTLYLECNDLTHGVTLFEFLSALGYHLYLHRAKAFNAENFKKESGNPFGVAHEINLLAVHPSKPSLINAVSTLVDARSLLRTQTIDELGKAFFETPRYGDSSIIDRDPVALKKALEAIDSAPQASTNRPFAMQSICVALASINELLGQTSIYLSPPSPKNFGTTFKKTFTNSGKPTKDSLRKLKDSSLLNLDFIRLQREDLPSTMEEFIPLYAKERSLWGINTHPLFLALYYQITHLISPEVPPLLHYTLSAPEISLHPHPLLKGVIDIPKFLDTPWQDRQETFTAFDQRWYLTQYPDLRASGIDPLMHFAQYGWKEGRDPNSAVRGNLLIKSLGDAISPFLYFIVLEKLAEQFNHA